MKDVVLERGEIDGGDCEIELMMMTMMVVDQKGHFDHCIHFDVEKVDMIRVFGNEKG